MSSTEIVESPKKKSTKQKMEQIVSSGVTNGCNLMDNSECSDGDNNDESANEQTLIPNLSETNKDCHVDSASMEPLLIQNCVDEFSTNPINDSNCVLSDESAEVNVYDEESPTEQQGGVDGGGGGFIKSNLSLNLNDMPKNKKFLESSDDQIINQIFFSTITVTPTTDDDVLASKFLSSDNTPLTPNETDDDPEMLVGHADFFNRKIDEDDTTFTDTAENYQENDDGNLCSLNDNFNENYCSFSSIDYNTDGQHQQEEQVESPENPNEDLLQPDNFLGDYAELMRQQRPSIVIDCYDSDSNSEKNSQTDDDNVVVGEEKINDYCFYFDQTIEEDDDDACYPNGIGHSDNSEDVHSGENGSLEDEIEKFTAIENGKQALECFETEDEIFNDEGLPNECDNECDDDKSLASDEEEDDDEGVINENCLSVNSAVESLESETTVVKKSVKKSVKTSKTTSKKATFSTTESSSITSSKAESFENSFSNGSVEVVEQHHVVEQQASVVSSKSVDSSSGVMEVSDAAPIENGEKKKLNGKKKTKKSKKSDSEKENISVTASSLPASVKVNHAQYLNCNSVVVVSDAKSGDTEREKANNRKLIMSSSLQLHEDDLSRIDVKSLKQKYSNAIEKQSSRSNSVTMNGVGYLGIRKDMSVKHLCRSFGDLTSLSSEEYSSNHFQHVYRDSYCSLIGLTDSNSTHHQQQPDSLMLHKRTNNIIKASQIRKTINLGIKQFDMKSSFSKFDALQKKNMQNLQNGRGEANGQSPEAEKKCHACGKVVFQMEQVKAEKKFWHKNCFKCSECTKNLTVDTYQSHEGILFCKPHYKTLFAPKAVEESNEPVKPRKLEMIIRENQPVELPPDVVRSSDKADLGLEELQQLNVRQRFQVFENAGQQEAKQEFDKTASVKRSTSILSKLARFQAKGMDVGVVDDSLNGICYEHSSSEEEEEFDDDENQEDIELIRAKRAQKEKPMSFKEMHDIKSKFENGQYQAREERREERKQELQNIRSRLFMGKQAKIKEMYQQAVADSEQTITAAGKMSDLDISDKDNARSLKERFEKGEIYDDGDARRAMKEEEMSVFEQGIGKQSRSLFLELDASASKSPIQQSPSSANLNRQTPRQHSQTMASTDEVVRSDVKVEDVQIETADIVSKFKFFETYKPAEKEKKQFRITPPRDGVAKLPTPESDVYRDPHIARNENKNEQDDTLEMAENAHTASKMLSMFRQLEEHKEQRPVGPKPLKRFTPPPDEGRRFTPNEDSGPEYSDSEEEEEECEEEEESEEELNPNYVKSSHKNVDEFLQAAQSAERAKQLREKFEKWEKNEIKKEMNSSSVNLYEPTTEADEGQMETAKSLRARFEQMQQEEPKLPNNGRIKVNRFV